MPTITITTRTGSEVTVTAPAGRTLMEILRERGEVEAACGGQSVCATCHIHIAPEWMAAVGEPEGIERELLDNSLERCPNSRLSCQIQLDDTLDGLRFTVAPEEG